MSLDKAILHGKEHRKTYKQKGMKTASVSKRCRPNGGGSAHQCFYCKGDRLFNHIKNVEAASELQEGWGIG